MHKFGKKLPLWHYGMLGLPIQLIPYIHVYGKRSQKMHLQLLEMFPMHAVLPWYLDMSHLNVVAVHTYTCLEHF